MLAVRLYGCLSISQTEISQELLGGLPRGTDIYGPQRMNLTDYCDPDSSSNAKIRVTN